MLDVTRVIFDKMYVHSFLSKGTPFDRNIPRSSCKTSALRVGDSLAPTKRILQFVLPVGIKLMKPFQPRNINIVVTGKGQTTWFVTDFGIGGRGTNIDTYR